MVTVYLVEESPQVRNKLIASLEAYGNIRVAGSTDDPFVAWEQIIRQPIDVLLLDTGLTHFNSLTFFRYLLDSCPLPTVLLSVEGESGRRLAVEALRYGAVSIWPKKPGADGELLGLGDLVSLIQGSARIDRGRLGDQGGYVPDVPVEATGGRPEARRAAPGHSLIAVGGSTGAVAAMQTLFSGFTAAFPPTVAVIHLPEGFTTTFAGQLDAKCEVTVKEAEDGETPLPGHIYIAPGNRHLILERRFHGFAFRLIGGPRVFFQRPAVDVLFHSVADVLGAQAIGVLLTGMGRDGAEGLLRLRQAGAHTITQDEKSCVVYGMPREAVLAGASCQELPLDRIAGELQSRVC
jgi:two-component system chemotaxis response regulator CheB